MMTSPHRITATDRADIIPPIVANGHAQGEPHLESSNDLVPDAPSSERPATDRGQVGRADTDITKPHGGNNKAGDVSDVILEEMKPEMDVNEVSSEPEDRDGKNHGNFRHPPSDVTFLPAVKASESSGVKVKGAVMDEEQENDEGRGCCGRRKREAVKTVGILELFRYASLVEVAMMVVGTLAAMVTGCAQPVSLMLTGEIVNTFISNQGNYNGTRELYTSAVQEKIRPLALYYLALGGVALVSSYTAVSLWCWSGQRQITRVRKLFFQSVMRQDMAWFDTHPVAQLNSRFSDDIHKIHEGMADKVPVFLQWCSTCLSAYVVAFVMGWKLALAVLAFSPLFVTVAAATTRLIRGAAMKEMQAYAKAGAVAEQILRAIRTVQAFQGQEKERQRYEENLTSGRRLGTRKGLVMGAGTGMFSLVLFSSFAISYYYGIILIQKEAMEPGNVFVVFFAVLFGSLCLGNAFPNLETFSNARAAAVHVFDVIDRHPRIDISSNAGQTFTPLNGVIDFQDVRFRYPARPDVQVLDGLTLHVKPGQTVALVGSSGCGKSTTVQLLQRFYDPQDGQILIDGHDLKDLNLRWLRDHLGVVSQEPVLFAATIADNIRYGHPEVTQDLIEAAAVEANAHGFISQLPQGYDTLVGERGAQLSGGQKQRIAIARALVKNPRILLLDEATSALDHESEAVVQSALDKARQGRTTIIIAHRLSTIRYADVIVTLSGGRQVEQGSHEELMARQGMYADLVKVQSRAEEEESKSCELDDVIEAEDNENDVTHTPMSRSRSFSTGKKPGDGGISGGQHAQKANEGEAADTVQEEEEEARPVSLIRLLKASRPEWSLLFVGTATSGLCGLSQPCFAFVFSQFLSVFAERDPDEQLKQTMVLCAVIAAVGVAVAVLRLSAGYCFSNAGSALTARLRSMTFSAILRQDMSFFDQQDHQVGSLTTRLASDTALVQGATGSKLGSAVESLFTVVAAMIIAFVFGWKLTFIILAFLPVVMIAGRVQGEVLAGSVTSGKSQLQEAGMICSEAVDNIRTVMSLNSADIFIHKMESLLDSSSSGRLKTAQVFGVTYALSVSVQYFALSTSFVVGSKLVSTGEMEFYNIFRVFGAIIMGGSAVGRNSSIGVDYSKGRVAAARLFAIIDRVPRIGIQQTGGKTLTGYRGQVSVDRVVFQYPSRERVSVLSGMTVSVEPGQTLALVGPSGCGKSTVMQLLLRFYDPTSGAVLLDGEDARELDLRWLRQQMAMVAQEPTLFDDTIAANIAYGDTSRQVPMDDIIAAARAANIHNFIISLPQGYDTQVGDKGTQLSGGQKQRIAIARALVRQPKVLLLDEATSALDTDSERIVQEALDKARQGRTCIVIAHRLTTVQNADLIAVVQHGRLQEMGTHSQLLASKGAYYNLLQAHTLSAKPPSQDQSE